MTLVKKLKAAKSDEFPHETDYWSRYKVIKKAALPYQTNSEKGASQSEPGLLLNDHGPEHIAMVIKRADSLLDSMQLQGDALTPYETFILLSAIQIHDIGNVYGRNKHEIKNSNFLKMIYANNNYTDRAEPNVILMIAQAHGGKIDGDQDKISKMDEVDECNSEVVRQRALAAILRLADELAEDKTRANRFLLNHDLIDKKSKIFHQYSSALNNVKFIPNDGLVKLNYEISTSDAIEKSVKPNSSGDKEVYLVDYIHERAQKTFTELIYCQRHFGTLPSPRGIAVEIKIWKDIEGAVAEIVEKIEYTLQETGYPSNIDFKTILNSNYPKTGEQVAENIMKSFNNEGDKDE